MTHGLRQLKRFLPQAGRPHSLRRRLMSYLVLVWLIMLLLIGASVIAFVQRTEANAWRGRQGEAARNAASSVAAFIQRANNSLTLLALLGSDELAAEPQVMETVLAQNPVLQEVVLLDAQGRVVAHAPADRPLLANLFTIPQSQWFLQARTGEHYYGSIQISSRDEPYLIMAVPAPDGGVVATRLRMDLLWEVVADIRFGASGRAYVVTQDGQIIAHTDPQVVLDNTHIGALAGLTGGPQGPPGGEWYGEYTDLQGQKVVGVAASVPGTQWLVITELPQREAFATSRAALLLLSSSLLLLMAITMWVSVRYLGRTIFQPLEALRDGTHRIGTGDLGHRIAIGGEDEVGQVAIAFNAMAQRLQERDAQLAAHTAALSAEVNERKQAQETLRRQNHFLSALYETTLALMNRLEIASVLEQIVAHACQLLGTPDGYVYLEGPHPGEIEVKVGLGVYQQRIGYCLRVGEGLAGRVWDSGQALRVDDYDAWAGRSAAYPYGDGHAIISVPLKAGGQVVGVLGMSYAEPDRRFEDDQLELLERFAQLASLALDNARLYSAAQQELAERKQAQEALRQLNEELEARVERRTAELASANQSLQAEIAERRRAQEALSAALDKTARNQRLLLALSQAAQAVQRAHTPDQVYQTLGDEIVKLGYQATVFILSDDRTHLEIAHITFDSFVLRMAERLAGLSAAGYRFPLAPGGFYQRTLAEGRTVFSDPAAGPIAEALPGPAQPLAERLASVLGIGQAIYAPLIIGDQVEGLLTVIGTNLTQDDVPAMTAFANQAAIAVENARLYASQRQHTAELARTSQQLQQELLERQRVEAALRESEERYRLHFENVSDVVYSIDPELKIASISPSVKRYLGYTPQELVGRPIQELGLVAPDCLEVAFRDTLRVLEGERIESAVYTFVTRDGRHLIGEVSGAPLLRDDQIIASVSVARDITERIRAEEQLKASLHEKEVLLKEIHHRVKNNLQIISSLLKLQSARFGDAATLEVFRDSQHRVRSMALIHEKLYRSTNLAQIDFAEYIRDLASFLFRSYEAQTQEIRLNIQAEDVLLGIDNAVPCGLIVNELLSNALKHAFPPDEGRQDGNVGEIYVKLSINGDRQVTLTIGDNGIGFPADVDFQNTSSLGLQLVNTLVSQLDGTLELDRSGGTRFSITFAIA